MVEDVGEDRSSEVRGVVLKDNTEDEGSGVHGVGLEVHDERLGVRDVELEVHGMFLEVHDEELEVHDVGLEDSAEELLPGGEVWRDKEGGRDLCLYRADCALCGLSGGGHCEEGGRAGVEVSRACGEAEVCEAALLDGELSHSPTSWVLCRSEPWNDDG